MKSLRVNPGSLRVTENNYLDPSNVRKFYLLYKRKETIGPVVIVHAGTAGGHYIVDGHHRSYGAFLAKIGEFDATLLETDIDVKECNYGKARRFSTLSELLEDCRAGHGASSAELGLDNVCDYAVLQPMPSG